MIEVKNLTKKYSNFLAVDDISFQVNDNEVVGFLGPNGAGKSTTMNIITGYIEPTKGRVVVNGYDMMREPKKAKKEIGYMPENVPLYKELTVKEFINYMAELKHVNKRERKDEVERVMKETGIENVSNKLIKFISKGYKQRTALAAALIGDPDVLILDEPTVGLDPKQITEIRNLVKTLGKKHTVILSSHILSEVSQICERVIIINHGQILAVDTPDNLEKQAERKNSIFVTVNDPKGNMSSVKEKIKGVTDVKLVKNNDDDSKLYEIVADKAIDVRTKVFEVLPKLDVEILELKKNEVTLEDAFLQLINEKEEEKKKAEASQRKEEKAKEEEFKQMNFKEKVQTILKERKEERIKRHEAFEEEYEKDRRQTRREKDEFREEKAKRKEAKKVLKSEEKEIKNQVKNQLKLEKEEQEKVIKINVLGNANVKKRKNKEEEFDPDKKKKTNKKKGGKK